MPDMITIAQVLVAIAIGIAFCRCLQGPTTVDRLLGTLFAGTGGAALLVLMAIAGPHYGFLDAGFVLVVLAPVLTVMMITRRMRGSDR